MAPRAQWGQINWSITDKDKRYCRVDLRDGTKRYWPILVSANGMVLARRVFKRATDAIGYATSNKGRYLGGWQWAKVKAKNDRWYWLRRLMFRAGLWMHSPIRWVFNRW